MPAHVLVCAWSSLCRVLVPLPVATAKAVVLTQSLVPVGLRPATAPSATPSSTRKPQVCSPQGTWHFQNVL